MGGEPTYNELVQRVSELEKQVCELNGVREELQKSRALYHDLVETLNDVIWEVNIDGIYTYVSPRVYHMLGYEPEELLGKTFFEHMPEEEAQRTYDLFMAQQAATMPLDLIEIKKLHKDGSLKFLQLSGKPFFNANGEVLGYRGLFRNVTERKRTNEALQKSESEFRRLSSHLLESFEKERKRIGLELHDGIAQTVSAIKMRIEVALMLFSMEDTPNAMKSLEATIPIVQEAVEEVRRISRNLRPSILDNLGILATISWLCKEFETVNPAIAVEKQVDLIEDDVPEFLKVIIFRILQEAFNNIARHSQASLVRLTLKTRDSRIVLTIDDNGAGFDVEKVFNRRQLETGIGIASMKERSELSKGAFSIESRKEAGTTVRASWPVSPP
ncbi:MAG: PAS domain S-box protein [Deltaproteobacteria bacterium]|nr:PAS domain S-box protein [Deltaproteobacteria bacterium]